MRLAIRLGRIFTMSASGNISQRPLKVRPLKGRIANRSAPCEHLVVRIDPAQPVMMDDFARRFSMRAGNLMWLLGAGSSASAGIPTAWDMIWEFKQQLYVSQRRISPAMVADLANPAVRSSIQAFIDAQGRYPSPGTPDEYAALFEAVYPNEGDRRTYISGKVTGAKPSYGHIALAALMKAGHTRLVWSTNFDPTRRRRVRKGLRRHRLPERQWP